MNKEITAADRRRLATAAGINEQYLYQCLTARRDMNPEEAVRVEVVLVRELRRWDLCPNRWHRIWPELIGIEGAPLIGSNGNTGEACTQPELQDPSGPVLLESHSA